MTGLPPPSLPASASGQRWRGSALTVLVVGIVWFFCLRTQEVWEIGGVGRDVVPFLDLHGSLAAGELAHNGGNPYEVNSIDVFGRPHLYSRWWLVTGELGLTRADAFWLGNGLLATTLVVAVAILRPVSRREIALAVLLLVSPAWLLAVNRANNDLVIFLLVAAALATLRCTAMLPRLAAAGLLALATILKYFPAVTAVLLLEARSRREAWSAVLIGATLLVLGWSSLLPAIEAALHFLPRPSGLHTFGAPVIARAFGGTSPIWWLIPTATLGLWVFRETWRHTPTQTTADPAETREFVAGAALVTGCFFLGVSYTYKLIFAVWLLPLLWNNTPAPILGCSTRQQAMLALLFATLWCDGIAALAINLGIQLHWPGAVEPAVTISLVVSQALAWALVAGLVRSIAAYTLERRRGRFILSA